MFYNINISIFYLCKIHIKFVPELKSVSKASLCSLKDGDELSAAPRPDPPVWRGGGGESRGHGGSPEQQTQAAPSQGICQRI